jgi:tetraacyldisaccharide 4'-kinase
MMEKLWLKIIAQRRNPLFWPVLLLLWPVSWFYRLGLTRRERVFKNPTRLDVPVISVGNLTVGGTGKTPVVIEIAKFLLSLEKKVGIIGLGYKRGVRTDYTGKGEEITSVHFNGSGVDYVGDEAYMMAHLLPNVYFSVSDNKTRAAANLLETHPVDVIIVDDGFQHRRLYRNHDVLVIDVVNDLRREKIFPCGRLREPVRAALRADSIVLTRTNYGGLEYRKFWYEYYREGPISEVEFINDRIISRDDSHGLGDLAEKEIYFFAGIGGFRGLLDHLSKYLSKPLSYRQFRDHCRYNIKELALIKKDITRYKPDYMVTTHKDYVKLQAVDFGWPLYYLELQLNFITGKKALFEKLKTVVDS